jgi:S1-C subfamily serine protease
MAISITCPGCQSVYPVPENLVGKTIRCKKCGETVAVTSPPVAAPVAAARPVTARPAARVVADDDDDTARPAKAVARRRRDEDDDDAPRSKQGKKKSALPLLIVGGVLVLFLMAGGAAAVGYSLGLFGSDKDEQRQVTDSGGSWSPPPMPVRDAARPDGGDEWSKEAGRKSDAEKQEKSSGAAATRPPAGGKTDKPLIVDPLKPVTPPPAAGNPPPARPARDTLDAITLNKAKAATVFFEVESKNGRKATGSGWIGLESNLIFTNAHVVAMKAPGSPKPAKITAYIHSGTPQQREIPHSRLEILAVDREADLAVIRVLNESDLPAPLQVRPSAELPELEKAVILGFPGGYTLARITGSDKQPSVTVNPSSVGAVRRDSHGNLSAVQFRGGSAPGGSGGPIVDMDGNVIAVLFMGPADAVLASAACYGVPTEYVTGLVAGRVADVEYGQAYRKGGKIHIPVVARCLDPFERLKSVGIGYWIGDNHTRTRPPGTERTGQEPTDSDYQEVMLTYKYSKDEPVATGELVLPELPPGRAYWAQPFYSNALVGKQWLAGNPIKLTGPPVDLEPADLIVRYRPGTRRTLTLSNISTLEEFEEGEGADKSERLMIETTIKASEVVQRPAEAGAVASLLLNYEELKLSGQVGPVKLNDLIPKEVRGLLQEGIKQVQGLGHVNKDGEIYKTMSNLRGTGQFAPLFKAFSDETLESLRAASIKLPNTRVEPGFTWTDRKPYWLLVTIADGSELLLPQPGPGGRPQPRQPRSREYRYQQEVTYTYLGTRMRGGNKEAVVKIEGKITTPPGAPAGSGATGMVKGHAYIDLNTGTVLEAEVERDLEVDTSSDGIKKRVSGINKYKLSRGTAVASTG